jgi:hypothetical protein
MTVDRDEASALLTGVEGVESRVRQLLIYARVSDYLFLWGTIWALGYTGNYFLRPYADTLWFVLEGAGLIGTVAIVALHRRGAQSGNTAMLWRAALSVAAVIAFGTLWIHLLDMGWRQQVTFWPTLLGFILFLVGLWIGRALALAALAIFAVALTGYFVAGPYLHLWMAAATGGAMIAGGVWLRR